MPYYVWQGIDLSGKMHRGKTFARSQSLLDSKLLKRDIALLSHQQAGNLFLPPIKKDNIILFFERLAALLGAGILLPQAMIIIADYSSLVRLQLIAEQIGLSIDAGYSFSYALERYPAVFDRIMISLVAVGQEAGRLALSLTALIVYLRSLQEFRKKMRAALLMPFISLTFFILICFLIIFVMLPRLLSITGISGQQLPMITRVLVWLAEHGWIALAVVGSLIGFLLLFRVWLMQEKRRDIRDALQLKMPLLSDITIAAQMGWFCAGAALLVRNGVAVVPAFSIAKQMVGNGRLQHVVQQIIDEVSGGSTIYEAMDKVSKAYCWPEVVAMIQVGEQTGLLAQSLENGAQLYHDYAMRRLSVMTMIVQPLLLIILGLLIGLLIIAIYAPLFTLSITAA